MTFYLLTIFIITQAPDYCLSLYHFNVQYVPGGLEGYLGFNLPEFDLTSEEVEDRIIKESFEPLLDIYLSHPKWGADIELQGYMVEVMAERFPDVLNKLKTLVDREQIDLVSIHYSDQLFLAYPIEDMEWSIEINREVFDSNGLLLSPVVFAQEGQSGEGVFRFLGNYGYKIMILPEGLFRFIHSNEEVEPLYKLSNVYVIVGGADINAGVSVKWIYFDDGELAMTGGLNPYLGTLFSKDDDAIQGFIQKVETLEKEGCKVVKITDYVKEVTSQISPSPLPPIIDGTWHPESSLNMFRWMGGKGDLTPYVERDNEVLTLNYEASLTLRALEILAEEKGRSEMFSDIKSLKKELLLAQVSDSTGWNPWRTEVNYSLSKASYVLGRSLEMINEISPNTVNISLEDRRIGVSPWSLSLENGEFPIPYTVKVSGLEYEVNEYRYKDINGAYRLEIIFTPTGGTKRIEISFPLFEKRVEFTPALSRDVVSYDGGLFSFDKIGLAFYNGLVGLGDGYYLIKHTRHVHLAGIIDFEYNVIWFIDETEDEPEKFVFTLYKGDANSAISFAKKVNTAPVMTFGEEGCGCTESGFISTGVSFIFVWIVLYRIGRRKKFVS